MTNKSGWSAEKRLAKAISRIGLDETGARPIYGRCLILATERQGCSARDRELVGAELWESHKAWLTGQVDAR